jgi:3-oxoacyl-[acyl-carrier protein] reductase
MDLKLSGKVAVVLAGSAGIGKGIAEALAQEGCNIAICARSEDRLLDTADFIQNEYNVEVFSEVVDVSSASELEIFLKGVVERFGVIDILINNTGGPKTGKTLELSDDEYQHAYELVLMSKIRASKFVVPYMIKNGYGRIINVESTSIKCVLDNMTLSNVFRSASVAFAKTLSREVVQDGIRVHTVMTGPMMTDRVTELGEIAANEQEITFEQWKEEAQSSTPMKRFGNPIEFGNFVAFLASDKSDYMTGTCVAFDGGILTTVT